MQKKKKNVVHRYRGKNVHVELVVPWVEGQDQGLYCRLLWNVTSSKIKPTVNCH